MDWHFLSIFFLRLTIPDPHSFYEILYMLFPSNVRKKKKKKEILRIFRQSNTIFPKKPPNQAWKSFLSSFYL